jgi:hypothetical protein
MKKTLLSLGLAVLAFGGFAQETTDCSVKENGVTENYAGAAAPAGVFYWGNLKEDATGQEPSFSYTRNTETQMLDITVAHADTVPLSEEAAAEVAAAEAVASKKTDCHNRQPKNLWAPMGIDINYAQAGDEGASYLDVSAMPSGSASFKNPGDKNVEVYFAVLSTDGENKNVVNATLIDTELTLWGAIVKKGEDAVFEFDLANAVNRIWVDAGDVCGVCESRGGTILKGSTNDCILPDVIDAAKISGAEFTVNEQLDVAPWNGPLDGYAVNLDYVKFGACAPVGLESNAAASGFEVYPNPAQSLINFNHTVNGSVEVELSNTLGSTVSATSGSSMNVAELPAGIYFATLKVNGVATAVQRVQVQ